jgi:hypothetical protein
VTVRTSASPNSKHCITVHFDTLPSPSALLPAAFQRAEEVHLPAASLSNLIQALELSRAWLPPSQRHFGKLDIGFLERL